ncbi:HAD family hydrolase [Anaerosalibacter massiliensis]|uniref:HAD family hydrolase n=2 Tax=Anaerosalibacter massiliensis TaxID=1347392 RepID=A0A9X2MJ02_9FIRM|nr:HAD family hydrolase [Anaerosalibacter massiliensis]MCR2044408.1 HAD family hydrolase [Anaerosalibacter massiliensis]
MLKTIFCDLDGTLLDNKNRIVPGTAEAIRKFTSFGGEFIIATGRLDHDIVYVEKRMEISGLYRISQNGAVIKDHHGNMFSGKRINSEIARQISKLLYEKDIRFEVSDFKRRYFPSSRPEGEVAEFVDSSIIIPNMYERIGIDIFPTIFLIFGNLDIFSEIRQEVAEKYGEFVDCVITSKHSLEIIPKDVSKGMAIRKIMDELKLKSNQVHVIGDSENDISMYEVTKNSYAMEHSPISVKEKSTYIYNTVIDCIRSMLNDSCSGMERID